jgi:hypothetical protein
MKRIFGHVVSLFAAALVVSAVLPACATNDQTIFVQSVLAPPLARVGAACTYLADPESIGLFSGNVDIGISDTYTGVLLVGNQLAPRGDAVNNRAESSRVHLNGGIIRVTEADGTLIREFTSYATGFADPGANSVAEFGVIGLTLIDAPTREILLNQKTPEGTQLLATSTITKTVLVNIKVFGVSLGGTEVESGEFQFPTQVCNGCLVDFTLGNDETSMTQPNCDKPLPATGGSGTILPCRAGQDEVTPCQLCKGKRNSDGRLPCNSRL